MVTFPKIRIWVSRGGALFLLASAGAASVAQADCARGFDPAHPAARLSEAGVFQSLSDRTVCAGFRNYEIRVPFWSDSAAKYRWLKIPEGAKVGFRGDDSWDFPVGSVFLKHFELKTRDEPRLQIETRILVRVAADDWRGFSYRWNKENTEAELVADEGALQTFFVPDPAVAGGMRRQLWRFPARQECLSCHRPTAGSVLGPRTEQVLPSLLEKWNHEGLFDRDIGAVSQYPAYVDPKDPAQALGARARSYLAANCAQCHHPASPVPTPIDLRFSTLLDQMRVVNEVSFISDLGAHDARIVKPGAKAQSVLWLRMSRRGDFQMPPLGSNRIDDAGSALIGSWIDQLTSVPANR